MVWKTREGGFVEIKDMTDSHLRNARKMLFKQVVSYLVLVKESIRRKIFGVKVTKENIYYPTPIDDLNMFDFKGG